MEEDQVILVNERDEILGVMDKVRAHKEALLHRAFSIFLFNRSGKMLLQQRALDKYHSAGLWSNACCSHPRPGESINQAAERRLKEELGFITPLEELFNFIYKAKVGNDLTEFEFDHVLVGEYDGPIVFNTDEVNSICFKDMDTIEAELRDKPALFTEWFHLAFPRILHWHKKYFSLKADGQRQT